MIIHHYLAGLLLMLLAGILVGRATIWRRERSLEAQRRFRTAVCGDIAGDPQS
jgi:hypothetical protein